MKPKGTGVIYLLKDRFQIYTNLLPDIQECHLPSHTVHNLNLVNKELLKDTVNAFITKYKIPASNLIIVVGDNASFITDLNGDDLTSAEKKFQEKVLLGQLIVRTIDDPYKKLLYGTNKEIYGAIKEAFEKRGSTIEFVMPGIVFENAIDAQSGLTLGMAAMIFRQTILHKKDNLLTNPFLIARQEEESSEKFLREQRKHDILHLYAYSSIFGVLIIGLLVIWNIDNANPSQTYRGRAENNQSQILPSEQETKYLTVVIDYDLKSIQTANRLKILLTRYHFQSVTLVEKAPNALTKSQILFSGRTSPTVRAAIVTEVKKYILNPATGDQRDTTPDIIINLRNNDMIDR